MIPHDKHLPIATQHPLVAHEHTFQVVSSSSLEMFMARVFNVEYNVASANEMTNGSYAKVEIKDGVGSDSNEVGAFLAGTGKRYFEPGLYQLFQYLVAHGYLKPGKYLISCSW
jgi:hypothetical protein